MKHLLMIAAAVTAVECFGIAASQAWVAQYVSNYVGQTSAQVQAGTTFAVSNGCRVVTANAGTTNEMRLVVQDFSDAAMVATNCTAAAIAQSVTNGTLFVWNGGRDYINPAGTISCTPTNLVWDGVASFPTNGVDRFVGWFDVIGVLIQPDKSFAITNGMEVTR